MQNPSFYIGDLPIQGNLILAPMDGYTAQPFRSLTRELGSAISYTEFINAIDVTQHHPLLEKRIGFLESERPVAFQFLDNDIERLEKAILTLLPRQPDFIDINLGCSSKQVTQRGAGASLLRDPQQIAQIFARLSKTINIPLTAKIRLGLDDQNQTYLEVAKIIQDNGGKLVAVHGRTRKQGYTGKANWDAIAEVKQSLSIPVIGNGDIADVAGIDRILDYTKCDAVMIGRAAIRNPWIFSKLDLFDVSADIVMNTFGDLFERLIKYYGEMLGIKFFRKYTAKFINDYPLDRETRKEILTQQDKELIISSLDKLVRQYHNTRL